MPFWDRPRRVRESFDAMADQIVLPARAPVAATGVGGVAPALTAAQTIGAAGITRQLAMMVPTIRRCRNVIAGTIATFDLSLWESGARLAPNPDTDDVSAAFLRRPDPRRTRAALIADTVDDLFFYDRSHWWIEHDPKPIERNGRLIPTAVKHIPYGHVSKMDDPRTGETAWHLNGHRLTPQQLRQLIVFEGTGVGGVLAGAQTIWTALKLEAAAGRYADTPLPQVILKNTGLELDEDEQDELIEQYETARRRSSTAYLNTALDIERVGWSARELQLVDARQHSALECARLCNVIPHYAMAPTQESMTYTNVQDERRDLVDISLRPYMDVISQTLSVDAAHGLGYTLCATGREVALDPQSFLRLSDLDRAALWNQLGPTGAGVLTVEEMRGREPLAPEGNPDA